MKNCRLSLMVHTVLNLKIMKFKFDFFTLTPYTASKLVINIIMRIRDMRCHTDLHVERRLTTDRTSVTQR
jgi:hypothetical protein